MVDSALDYPSAWSPRSGDQPEHFATLLPPPSVPVAAAALGHELPSLLAFAESVCTFGPRVRRQRKEELREELRVDREIEDEYELKARRRWASPPPQLYSVPTTSAVPPALEADEFEAALVAGALIPDFGDINPPRRERKTARKRREQARRQAEVDCLGTPLRREHLPVEPIA